MSNIDEHEITLSGNYDSSDNINMRDYIPEALTRVYPYRAIYGKKGKGILQSNSKTIVRISQTGVDDLQHLEVDENGDKYMEIFAAIDNITKKTIKSGTSTFLQDIRKVKTFTAITNDYIETKDDKPDFFTIGAPFDKDEFDKGDQTVYYGSNFTSTYPEIKTELRDLEFDIEDEDRISGVVLQDISVLENQFENASLSFRETSLPLNNASNITIKTLPNIMVDKVKVKGVSSGQELIDIDFKSTGDNLSWFQVIPITTKDKLEITTPWLDENITLDKSIIETIIKSGTNGELTWSYFCKQYQIPESLKNLVLDMLLYSYEFNNTFGQVPRTSEGAMVPKYLIGNDKIFVSSIANTSPRDTITGLYRKWRKLNPKLVGGDPEKIIKGFIAGLSQEIFSRLSVAGGENDFNKNVLPWRLKLTESIKPDIDDKSSSDDENKEQGWIILKDFKFTVDENPYFKFDKKRIGSLSDEYTFDGEDTNIPDDHDIADLIFQVNNNGANKDTLILAKNVDKKLKILQNNNVVIPEKEIANNTMRIYVKKSAPPPCCWYWLWFFWSSLWR